MSADDRRPFDLRRYHELRDSATRPIPANVQVRSGFWHRVDLDTGVQSSPTRYVRPAEAAEVAGVSTSKLAVWRRQGKVRSIGMTAGELKRARAAVGWTTPGWAAGVHYWLPDVERMRGRS